MRDDDAHPDEPPADSWLDVVADILTLALIVGLATIPLWL